jgi:hypothetical protein
LYRCRRRPIKSVLTQLHMIFRQHEGARISVLAHSFGTYIIAEILKQERNIKFHKIVFCGSIVPHTFFDEVAERIDLPIINEVGTRDIWPALADSVTKGYGRTGTYGFRKPGIRDRWHNRYRHSDFLIRCFCQKFWVPYFLDQPLVSGDTDPESAPWWVQSISVFKVKYLVPFVVTVFALLWWNWPAEYRVRIDAPENVGYLAPTIEALVGKFEEPCAFCEWLPFWPRSYAKIEYEDEAVRTLVVSQSFDMTSRNPLAILLALRQRYQPCFDVTGAQRQLRLSVNEREVSLWKAPDGTAFRLCKPHANAQDVLTRRHGDL